MKRDMDLVRKILMEVESWEPQPARLVELDGIDRKVIEYHVELINEAGLVEVEIATSPYEMEDILYIKRLTWQGHDFLDAARNDTVWKKTTGAIGRGLGSVSFEVLKATLNRAAGDMIAGGLLDQIGAG